MHSKSFVSFLSSTFLSSFHFGPHFFPFILTSKFIVCTSQMHFAVILNASSLQQYFLQLLLQSQLLQCYFSTCGLLKEDISYCKFLLLEIRHSYRICPRLAAVLESLLLLCQLTPEVTYLLLLGLPSSLIKKRFLHDLFLSSRC